MARIAVNTRLLLKGKLEGIGWFTFETLKRIVQKHPEHDFYFIFDRKHDPEFIFSKNVTPIEIGPPSRHPVLWYLWFEFSVTKVLKKINADVFFSPDGYLSLRTKVKSIPVIHDINFVHYPKDLPYLYQKYYNTFFPKYAQKAQKVITVSNYSKQDMIKEFLLEKDKVEVVFNGVNERFTTLEELEKTEIRKKYTNGSKYFIFLGSLHPRKNVVRLFNAFNSFCLKNPNYKLLIVGEKMFWTENIKKAYESIKNKNAIIFTGHLSQEELFKVVPAASCLLYISYFEGFGIPLLEAMASGTPIITSNITAMPEIADNAAIKVDPFSVEEITNAMHKICSDQQYSNQLVNHGFERVKFFSWDKTAAKTWDVITEVLNSP
jgi:glycosyltransferase involved in cell wall biosynthesis